MISYEELKALELIPLQDLTPEQLEEVIKANPFIPRMLKRHPAYIEESADVLQDVLPVSEGMTRANLGEDY